MKITIPSQLSDDALVCEVKYIAGRARETTVQLVAHLAELDARRLYLGVGFSSLFIYCREVLRLSEGEAYNRIEAARAARRFPVLLDMLVEGTLNLTTVRLLAPHLTDVNRQELLGSAVGKSRREVEELLAQRHPRPDVARSLRTDIRSGLRLAPARARSCGRPRTSFGTPSRPGIRPRSSTGR